jgi:serine/threonine protein kinase
MKFDKSKAKFIPIDPLEEFNGDLIGTAEYVAPETLENKNIGIGVDLWALGCILYLIFHGKTPFKDKTDLLIFDNVLHKTVNVKEVVYYNIRISMKTLRTLS